MTTLDLVLERSIDQYADYSTVIDGILLDLTDYELKAAIRRTYTSEVSIEFTIEILQATVPAIIQLSLTRNQTAMMVPGRYVWDLIGTKNGISRRLREGGAIVQPGVTDPDISGLDPTIIAAINAAIGIHNLNPLAHPNLGSGGSIAVTKLAAIPISGFRAVVADSSNAVIYADNTIASHATRVLGLTLNAANADEDVVILPFGEIVEATWTWTPEQPIYLSTEGVLTQTLPATGFLLILATAITATRIFVNVNLPILR